MNALDALHSRISVAFLTDPAPDEAALVNIYKSALRAADHGRLRPWRFLVVKGPARERLGDLFLEAALADDASLVAEKQDKISRKPLRAPMLLVTVSSIKQHPKVPLSSRNSAPPLPRICWSLLMPRVSVLCGEPAPWPITPW